MFLYAYALDLSCKCPQQKNLSEERERERESWPDKKRAAHFYIDKRSVWVQPKSALYNNKKKRTYGGLLLFGFRAHS